MQCRHHHPADFTRPAGFARRIQHFQLRGFRHDMKMRMRRTLNSKETRLFGTVGIDHWDRKYVLAKRAITFGEDLAIAVNGAK